MQRLSRRLLLSNVLTVGALFCLDASPAAARTKTLTRVKWVSVKLPSSEHQKRREQSLRKLLSTETRLADWGKHKANLLQASVTVTEFRVNTSETVVQVTCTAMARLGTGPSVRTHVSLGDHPTKQRKLENMILTLVARSLVTRLSAIARARSIKTPAP